MRRIPRTAASLCATALLGFASSLADAVELSYGGRIVDAAGAPATGSVDLTLRFFGSEAGRDQLGLSKSFPRIPLSEGVFQLSLSLDANEQAAVFGDGSRVVFVEFEAAGRIYPRQRVAAVPVALRIPVDNDTLVYGDDAKLTVDHVSISQVTGLTQALAERAVQMPASSSADGYLAAAPVP